MLTMTTAILTKTISMHFMEDYKRRVVAILLFLFLFPSIFSCSTPCAWVYDDVETACSQYNSSRIYLTRHHPDTGIDVEIIRTRDGMRMYLNFSSFPIKSLAHDSTKGEVCILINGSSTIVEAFRFEGGQRLLLPCSGTHLIIESLLVGTPVTLSTGCYREVLTPQNFRLP